jgi:hypothetical protein
MLPGIGNTVHSLLKCLNISGSIVPTDARALKSQMADIAFNCLKKTGFQRERNLSGMDQRYLQGSVWKSSVGGRYYRSLSELVRRHIL